MTYRIRDWEKHYENGETRRYVHLHWVPVPNKHDGKGFRRIAALPNSERVLCGWYLMLELASKMPKRGVLADDDGALTPADMAFKTGFSVQCFQEAIEALMQPEIAWLTAENCNNIAQKCAAPAQNPALNRTEQNRTEVHAPPSPNARARASQIESENQKKLNGQAAKDFESVWLRYPKKADKLAAERMWFSGHAWDHTAAIHEALDWQTRSEEWKKEKGRFVPKLETYLEHRRWEDEQPDSEKSISLKRIEAIEKEVTKAPKKPYENPWKV